MPIYVHLCGMCAPRADGSTMMAAGWDFGQDIAATLRTRADEVEREVSEG